MCRVTGEDQWCAGYHGPTGEEGAGGKLVCVGVRKCQFFKTKFFLNVHKSGEEKKQQQQQKRVLFLSCRGFFGVCFFYRT